MSDVKEHWYLAQLKPNGLARAKVNLERQGFEPFSPYRNRVKRVGARLKEVREPLFPGYVFLRFDPQTTQWRKVNSTYGVSRLVALQANTPTRVPPAIMDALLSKTAADGCVEAAPEFAIGDDVRVISGPFVDFLGKVDDIPGPERVLVLLEMMGQSVRAKFRNADLERRR